jgi:hypothetical protein
MTAVFIYSRRSHRGVRPEGLQTRGLVDGTILFAEDDVVKAKVLPRYKMILQSRGQYLAHFHQQQRATAAFEEARRFDSKNLK